MKLEEQFRKGILTHLIEVELHDIQFGQNGYRCAACGLGIIAENLRKARKVAEKTYGTCPYPYCAI